MITVKLQLILCITSVIVFLVVFQSNRKRKLEIKYSILWFFLSVILIILSIFPKIALLLANFVGIETPINLLFLIGIFLLFSLLFHLTFTVSKLYIKQKSIVQKMALLINELDRKEL